MDRYTDREMAELIYRYFVNPWDDASIDDIEEEIKNDPREVLNFLVDSIVDYIDRTERV